MCSINTLVLLILCLPCFGQDTPSLMQKGMTAYKEKHYAEARDAFQGLLAQGHNSPAVLNNLALSELGLDHKALALALWRKALSMQPGFRPAEQGRAYLESKLQPRALESDGLAYWSHRNLENLPLFALLWVEAAILAALGVRLLSYWKARQLARLQESATPAFPASVYLLGASLVAFGAIAGLKARDSLLVRATITADRTSVRSLPSDDSVSLFEVNGGSEVWVRREQQGWTQVQNAEGASGWIKDGERLITSDTGDN